VKSSGQETDWRLLLSTKGEFFITTFTGAYLFKYRTRSSPVIWRIYIEFEIRVGELQRAKKLVFRAIGECPLVKGMLSAACGLRNF